MDLYNNYYEELYHAGLFSALRGRIRDGHKWITRTGTPGHYVYTYAKDLAGKARSMFGKPRGMFGTRKNNSSTPAGGAINTNKNYDKRTGHGTSSSRKENQTNRDIAEKEKREDRFVDRTSKALAKRDSNPNQHYFNKDGKPEYNYSNDTNEYVFANGRRRSAVKNVVYNTTGHENTVGTGLDKRNRSYRVTARTDYASSSPIKTDHGPRWDYPNNYNESLSEHVTYSKSAREKIKDFANNTLSSIRKTANDAAGAVSKGYESAKNWVNDLLKKARGASWNNVDLKNGHAGLTGSKPKGWDEYYNRNSRTSRTTYNEYMDARRKKAAVEFAKNHRNSAAAARKGASASGRVVSNMDEYYDSAKNRETGKDRPNVRANASHNTKENRHTENVKRELRELAIEDHNQRQAARTGEALLSLANSNNRNFDEWKPSESGRVVSTTTDKKGTVTKKYGDGNVLEYDSKPVTVSNMDEWRKKYYEPAMSGTNSNKKRRRTGNR